MTKQNNNTNKPIYIAIDEAKKFHGLFIHLLSGKIKLMKIVNNRASYDQIITATNSQMNQVITAIEPTANYHRLFAYWLHDSGIKTHLAGSISYARAKEMLFQTWDKKSL